MNNKDFFKKQITKLVDYYRATPITAIEGQNWLRMFVEDGIADQDFGNAVQAYMKNPDEKFFPRQRDIRFYCIREKEKRMERTREKERTESPEGGVMPKDDGKLCFEMICKMLAHEISADEYFDHCEEMRKKYPGEKWSLAIRVCSLRIKDHAKAEWDKSLDLRAEFGDDFKSYLAHKRSAKKEPAKVPVPRGTTC